MVVEDESPLLRSGERISWSIGSQWGSAHAFMFRIQQIGEGLQSPSDTALTRYHVHELSFEIGLRVLKAQSVNLFALI